MDSGLLGTYAVYYALKELPGHIVDVAEKASTNQKSMFSKDADSISHIAEANANGKARFWRTAGVILQAQLLKRYGTLSQLVPCVWIMYKCRGHKNVHLN